jgi:undecaprenyl-phosphate 4-deoxy-4-formamido-L-arabinose transferase
MPDSLLSVVIPAYRSEAYLEATVRELTAALQPAGRFEVVIVNDGSPDGVQRVIEALCAADSRVRGVALGRNLGQHRATLQGMARARGDVVVTVDDDGQNPPAAALAVARALVERDLDVVYGRFGTVEQARARRLASALNGWLSRHTLQNRTGVSLSNVRAIRGDLARALGAVDTPYPYIDAMIFRMTTRIGEVPVEHRARGAGASTYTLGKLLRLWISHLTSLSVMPLKAAMVGSFAVSALGFVLGAVQMARALLERQAPAGWLSLFCAVTFLFSVLFLFLGIISAYLGRMHVSLNERGLVWIRSDTAGPAEGRAQGAAGADHAARSPRSSTPAAT